jgi:hypothetical protein
MDRDMDMNMDKNMDKNMDNFNGQLPKVRRSLKAVS